MMNNGLSWNRVKKVGLNWCSELRLGEELLVSAEICRERVEALLVDRVLSFWNRGSYEIR